MRSRTHGKMSDTNGPLFLTSLRFRSSGRSPWRPCREKMGKGQVHAAARGAVLRGEIEGSVLEYIQFLLSTAGLSCMIVMWAKDFSRMRVFSDGRREKMFPLFRKPFICPLCVGFYVAPFIAWHFWPDEVSWMACIVHAFAGAVFSWFVYSKITGEY